MTKISLRRHMTESYTETLDESPTDRTPHGFADQNVHFCFYGTILFTHLQKLEEKRMRQPQLIGQHQLLPGMQRAVLKAPQPK